MITRITTRLSYLFVRAATMRQPHIQTGTMARAITPVMVVTPRAYSQQVNEEILPTVEFDYVKRATSQKDVIIIDVREPDEIKEHGKIPNSLNIPLGTVSETLSMSEKDFQKAYNIAKPNENTELIFYCMIGRRSAKAQQSAMNLGYKNTKNYLGSWTDWAVKIK